MQETTSLYFVLIVFRMNLLRNPLIMILTDMICLNESKFFNALQLYLIVLGLLIKLSKLCVLVCPSIVFIIKMYLCIIQVSYTRQKKKARKVFRVLFHEGCVYDDLGRLSFWLG